MLDLRGQPDSHRIYVSFSPPFVCQTDHDLDIILVVPFQLNFQFLHVQATSTQPMHQDNKGL